MTIAEFRAAASKVTADTRFDVEGVPVFAYPSPVYFADRPGEVKYYDILFSAPGGEALMMSHLGWARDSWEEVKAALFGHH